MREHRAPTSDPAAWQALAAPCVHAARPSGSLLVDRIRHATALVRRCTLDEPGRTPRLLEKASPPLGLPRRGVRGPAALGAPRALDRRAARAAVAQRSAAGRLHVRPRRADAAEERAPPPTLNAHTCGPPLCTVSTEDGRTFAWPPAGRDCVRVMRCVYLMRPGSASVKPDRSLLYTRLSAHAITRVPRTGPFLQTQNAAPPDGLSSHPTAPGRPAPTRRAQSPPDRRRRGPRRAARTPSSPVPWSTGRGSQRRAAATSDSDSLPSSTPPRSRRARRRACRPRLPPRQQPPPSYARA